MSTPTQAPTGLTRPHPRRYLGAVGLLTEEWKGHELEISLTPQGEAMVRDVLWLMATGPVRR